ncbi:hypothetical protein IAG44_17620 [Streptomyces roseirectus]|uniref:Uncharacterized protein n=1 Tax=Streptomyces roseirectus TaxID=2768066 RepID=A0A7H0IE59_9ACTN|nr:hypothetical protein [Streptomyces roseirectus]QNP71075.1 hypothetical protein IAG44_17620 [Streptomyces roseirectus]
MTIRQVSLVEPVGAGAAVWTTLPIRGRPSVRAWVAAARVRAAVASPGFGAPSTRMSTSSTNVSPVVSSCCSVSSVAWPTVRPSWRAIRDTRPGSAYKLSASARATRSDTGRRMSTPAAVNACASQSRTSSASASPSAGLTSGPSGTGGSSPSHRTYVRCRRQGAPSSTPGGVRSNVLSAPGCSRCRAAHTASNTPASSHTRSPASWTRMCRSLVTGSV